MLVLWLVILKRSVIIIGRLSPSIYSLVVSSVCVLSSERSV